MGVVQLARYRKRGVDKAVAALPESLRWAS